MLYAKKRIKSGPMLEDLYYPVLPSGRLLPGSIPKTAGTSEAQKKYNAKKAEMQFVRMINTNFAEGDLFIGLTYPDDCPDRPKNDDEAARKMQNYIRRVKRWRKKAGAPEMKYAYSTHVQIRKSGKHKGEPVYHFHVFMTSMDRDVAEALWIDGAKIDARRFDPWAYGQESAARYMAKGSKNRKKGKDEPGEGETEELDRAGRRRFNCSRNCKKPKIPKTQQRMNISKRQAEDLATGHTDEASYWLKKVPDGYDFAGMDYILNEWNGLYYWRVTYRRLPEWNTKKKNKRKVKANGA